MDPPPNARIVSWSDFPALRFLGEGEFASAHSTTLDGEPVAVKVIKESKRGSEHAVRGLKREMMLLSLMRHPGIMHALALGQHDNLPFMVMPQLAAVLAALLPRSADAVPFWVRSREVKAWPLSRALDYGAQLAAALAYCHDAAFPGYRVLHRDLKPKNIGVDAHGRLVLFDFGLASIWKVGHATEDPCELRRLTGETGSLRYMAPEVARTQPYNHKAEVFSFASVLFEMCAHEKPFASFGADAFVKALANGVRPPVRAAWPPPLQALFARCWEARPADRPDFALVGPQLAEILGDGATIAAPSKSAPARRRSSLLGALAPRRRSSAASSASSSAEASPRGERRLV